MKVRIIWVLLWGHHTVRSIDTCRHGDDWWYEDTFREHHASGGAWRASDTSPSAWRRPVFTATRKHLDGLRWRRGRLCRCFLIRFENGAVVSARDLDACTKA